MGIRSFVLLTTLFFYSSYANAGVIDDIYTSINDAMEFRKNGIYTFFTELFAEAIQHYLIATIEFKIFMLGFAWDVAKAILDNLSINTQLTAAWSKIDSNTLKMLTAFKIPDALNIVLSGSVTRFVLRFIS